MCRDHLLEFKLNPWVSGEEVGSFEAKDDALDHDILALDLDPSVLGLGNDDALLLCPLPLAEAPVFVLDEADDLGGIPMPKLSAVLSFA